MHLKERFVPYRKPLDLKVRGIELIIRRTANFGFYRPTDHSHIFRG